MIGGANMSIFGKSQREIELERENQMLRELLLQQPKKTSSNASSTPKQKKEKKVLYQCRYCGIRETRNASAGAPFIHYCPRHPKGNGKGPHSWMRTYL